jgi:hypothetical protein
VADEAVSYAAEEVEEKILPVLNLQTFPVYQEGGEGDIGLRLRNMFIPQLGEAVVGADEEVVAADVVIVIIWRTMGRHGFGQFTPLQLDGVLQLLPSKDGTVMNLGLIKTGRSTVE